jgi:hypothetical protein
MTDPISRTALRSVNQTKKRQRYSYPDYARCRMKSRDSPPQRNTPHCDNITDLLRTASLIPATISASASAPFPHGFGSLFLCGTHHAMRLYLFCKIFDNLLYHAIPCAVNSFYI